MNRWKKYEQQELKEMPGMELSSKWTAWYVRRWIEGMTSKRIHQPGVCWEKWEVVSPEPGDAGSG